VVTGHFFNRLKSPQLKIAAAIGFIHSFYSFAFHPSETGTHFIVLRFLQIRFRQMVGH